MVDVQEFPIPEIIDPPKRRCICFPLPDDDEHIRIVAGWFRQLTLWYNWQRDPEKKGKDVAAVYERIWLELDWSSMSCCCNQPTIPVKHRTTNAGEIQISYDDGVTWIPDPADPRLAGTALPPPIPPATGTAQCDAATNGLQHLKDIQEVHSTSLGTATTVVELVLAIAGQIVVLVFLPESAPVIVPILIATVTALFALGKAAYDAYFTSTVWDKVLCALYCNIGTDGTFSDGGYQQVLIDIGTNLPAGVPRDMLYRDILAMGLIGLNNICSYGSAADADCSSCDCLGCSHKFGLYHGLGSSLTYGEDTSGKYVQVTAIEDFSEFGGWGFALTTGDSLVCCTLDHFEVTGTGSLVFAWAECGEAIPPLGGSFPHSGAGGSSSPVNTMLVARSGGIFTGKLYFV